MSAEEQAKRVALAGYVLDFTHQDAWAVAELRRVWDLAWAAAAAYSAYREQEHQQAAEAEVLRRCQWCDCEGQVNDPRLKPGACPWICQRS